MLKLIEYFAGTAKMRAKPENKAAVLSYMQKNGVFFSELCEKDGDIYFKVLRKSCRDKTLLGYAEIVEKRGLLCGLERSLKRPGIYIGAVMFIISLVLSDSVVWDVRYEPGGGENTERIAAVAGDNGLKSGAFKSGIDKTHIENLIMLKCPDVAYVNINISGTVATVVTDERISYPKTDKSKKTDLCASEDGYIIRYETYAGRTLCEKGQTVKRGDVLISGSYDTFHHGTVTTKARGRVFALVKRSFLCEINDTVNEKIYTGERYVKRALTVFSHEFGGDDGYDPQRYEKTSEIQTLKVFDIAELPVRINTKTYRGYSVNKRRITDAEAEKTLAQMYEKQYKNVTEDAEVQKTEIKKYHKDGKYGLYCEVYAVCNIAK